MPPFVSIIVPCYNEQATIYHLLAALLAQTYPHDRMEVVIADALSQDGTRAVISKFQTEHADLSIQVIDNVRRNIPSGLNLAVAAAGGEILIRLDAHSIPIPEYVERCVQALEQHKGDNIGGVWMIQPGGEGWLPNAIAAAASHPIGVGDAMYRLNPREGAVDTVPFGSFRRELIGRIGSYDETLLTNEDYEFNTRIRRAGGVVWLDPQIRSIYIARATLGGLAGQYWRYGYWKYKMLRRYPGSLRWRQALPPVFVSSLIVLLIASVFFTTARWLLAAEVLVYLAVLSGAALLQLPRWNNLLILPGFILAVATMHLFWGSGFLWSLVSTPFTDHG